MLLTRLWAMCLIPSYRPLLERLSRRPVSPLPRPRNGPSGGGSPLHGKEPKASWESHPILGSQQPLFHIRAQNPGDGLQSLRHHLLTAWARLKLGNSSAKEDAIVTRI